jgi:hypothetical protein
MEELDKVRTERDKFKVDLADNPLENTRPALEETPKINTAIWNPPSPSFPAKFPVEEIENHDFQALFYGGDWDPSLFQPDFL